MAATRGGRVDAMNAPVVITSLGAFGVKAGAPIVVPPSVATLFIGTAPKLAAFAFMMRLLVGSLTSLAFDWQGMLVILSLLSMIFGNVIAIAQTTVHILDDAGKPAADGQEGELYAGGAYLFRSPLYIGGAVTQDVMRYIIIALIIGLFVLATLGTRF